MIFSLIYFTIFSLGTCDDEQQDKVTLTFDPTISLGMDVIQLESNPKTSNDIWELDD